MAHEGAEIIERELRPDAAHGSDLMPAIDSLMKEASLTPSQLTRVVVGRGPGSYTGLRVAAATALGLARGTGAVAVGVPSFDSVAALGLEAGERGAVVTNAFGGNVYIAVYEGQEGPRVKTVTAPMSLEVDRAAEPLHAVDVLLASVDMSAAVKGPATLERREPTPSASALLQMGLACTPDRDASQVTPLYLRPFEAKVRAR